ncbi:MAG: hypothetical protein CTY19_18235, partial [Methylomonas sp.]
MSAGEVVDETAVGLGEKELLRLQIINSSKMAEPLNSQPISSMSTVSSIDALTFPLSGTRLIEASAGTGKT